MELQTQRRGGRREQQNGFRSNSAPCRLPQSSALSASLRFLLVTFGYWGSYGTANAEAQRTLQIVYNSANAVAEDRNIEIDQQSELCLGQAQVREQLSQMNGVQSVGRFYFDDNESLK
jgi:hypothetical protein